MVAPKMPGHTCPKIDALKRRIEQAYALAFNPPDGDEEVLRQCLRDIAHELRGEADTLEEIRDANLALRNCVEYWESEMERHSCG